VAHRIGVMALRLQATATHAICPGCEERYCPEA